jgi:hypothetical protein
VDACILHGRHRVGDFYQLACCRLLSGEGSVENSLYASIGLFCPHLYVSY